MSNHKATPEQWALLQRQSQTLGSAESMALLELRARVEALEGKYETQRLATLEWGKDVDNVKLWNDQHLRRIMALEAAQQPTIKESLTVAPAVSLVERVAISLAKPGRRTWDEMASDTIREVAAWMTSNPDVYFPPALVFALEHEAGK